MEREKYYSNGPVLETAQADGMFSLTKWLGNEGRVKATNKQTMDT